RTLKWQWIQHGLEAPGAANKIRLYDAYLHKMEQALADSDWLVGGLFTMADVAMAPYVNRLAGPAMERVLQGGRFPPGERGVESVRARSTFRPAFVDWMPVALAEEMRSNGERSWPAVRALLGAA